MRTAEWDSISVESIVLAPHAFMLAHTAERVALIEEWVAYVGIVHGKSSLARMGLMVHCAGYVDPGFHGQLTLELFNCGPLPIILTAGQKICQISLHATSGYVVPYGSRGASYNGQSGATPGTGERL